MLDKTRKRSFNRGMPISHQAKIHNHTFLKLVIAVLILGFGLLILKYIRVKQEWREHVVKLSEGIRKFEFLNQVEDGELLAVIATHIPSDAHPILSETSTLQKYILTVSEKTGRDIVVIDRTKKILADAVSGNVGTQYTEDKDGEIAKTLFDGSPRSFIEKSTDFPNGINQVVVQVKDVTGTIVGALIISSSNIFK